MSKDKLYHALETLCFTAALVLGSVAVRDLPKTIRRGKEFYIDNRGVINNKTRAAQIALNESKRYSIPETSTAIALAGAGYLLRSKRKGKSKIGPLEISCAVGVIALGYIAGEDYSSLRNASAVLGYLPSYVSYDKNDKKIAKEGFKEQIYLVGLETVVLGALVSIAARKKKD